MESRPPFLASLPSVAGFPALQLVCKGPQQPELCAPMVAGPPHPHNPRGGRGPLSCSSGCSPQETHFRRQEPGRAPCPCLRVGCTVAKMKWTSAHPEVHGTDFRALKKHRRGSLRPPASLGSVDTLSATGQAWRGPRGILPATAGGPSIGSALGDPRQGISMGPSPRAALAGPRGWVGPAFFSGRPTWGNRHGKSGRDSSQWESAGCEGSGFSLREKRTNGVPTEKTLRLFFNH